MLTANLAKGIKGPRELAANSMITPLTHPLISVMSDGQLMFLNYPDITTESIVATSQYTQATTFGAME